MVASGMLRFAIQMILLAAVVFYAWRKGGDPEKWVAATMIAMVVADRIYHLSVGPYGNVAITNAWHFLLDIVAFLALFAIAMKVDRLWTLLATSAQLISVMSHVLRYMSIQMDELVYAIMYRVPFYLLIALLALGTWRHQRRSVGERAH